MISSIPSPPSNHLGPFHMYGLMIALGVLAAIELGRKRWRDRGGDPDDIYAIAFAAVPAGLIGARLYHVLTDWRSYEGRWLDAFKIWQGGLGIPGGMALGVAVGVWVAHRRGMRISVALDALVPGLPLAQAIGRIGNWWNQELFGRPTSLPWGLRIDPEHRPIEYIGSSTFQPTFLYEMLWNLALCGLLIWIDRKRVTRPGNLLAIYVGLYFLGRLWIELLRVDTASQIAGVRVNVWLSIIGMGGAILVFIVRGFRRRPSDSDAPYRDGHDPARPISENRRHDHKESITVKLSSFPLTALDGTAGVTTGLDDRAVLVVNVASKCGLTPQYEGLERLQKRFADRGFTVLGVPCNQFMGQEPGTPAEIAEFCSSTYGVTFPLTEKVDVNGDDRTDLFAQLTAFPDAEGAAGDVQWNFEKFLVAPGGGSVVRFRPTVDPEADEVVAAIEAVLPA